VTQLGAPFAGSYQWWSGSGDDLDSSMSRQVTLPAGVATLTFQARRNIEDCEADPCDYAYVEVDDGSGWTAVPGSIANAAEGNGIDGLSSGWVPATFDLSAYAGKTIGLRMHYRTDGAVQGQDPQAPAGLFVDAIQLTAGGQLLLEDGAEAGADGWALDGFAAVATAQTTLYDNYYIASNRQYVAYDRYLQSGPYNVGFPARPDFVEHFPYQDGLLISYWDTSFGDNNESEHPGQGEILPIDAHPSLIYRLDGKPWRGRIQTYDAPFSLERADSFTLHAQETGRASYIRGQAAQPVFDDRRQYWTAGLANVGVKVPNAGVRMRVLAQNGTSMSILIDSTSGPGQ
jgi:immune inhibitor A